ncbi:MAG: glucose-6-phosphate 1-dehydrogenase [Acidobacteria bacterium]|nr:glucose-6-phosphate 1-dehydrogenase [Acidobacteriota bacterium]
MSSPHADPCILVIFGASGDLARRKLLPTIYNLAESDLLPEPFAVLGVARPATAEGTYRAQMRESVEREEREPLDTAIWERIESRLHYISGHFDDQAFYSQLNTTLADLQRQYGIAANYLFYLAIPPELFGTVGRHLAAAGLSSEREGWRRVVVEKPFGYDLDSARRLNAELTEGLREPQIYRIDHYLGKETVQNILAFRFANGIFEPIWNRRYVDHVQMVVAEEEGIGGRGAYYDKAGALRDIVQNHMFQVLSLVSMEPPVSFKADAVRDEKVKVLHAVTRLTAADVRRDVVRGQYAGYRGEPHVAADSRTDTYVALRLLLDNWRWAGVPFYLRTGKRLARRCTEVSVHFKRAPFTLFRETPVECTNPNVLVLRIQPDEGISLFFDAKVPGPLERLETVTMDFSYAAHFHQDPSTGYETLLFDAMAGDQTLFHRMDIVEAGWQIAQPMLEEWAGDTASSLPAYEHGSWGPTGADSLLDRDGRQWRSSAS